MSAFGLAARDFKRAGKELAGLCLVSSMVGSYALSYLFSDRRKVVACLYKLLALLADASNGNPLPRNSRGLY